MTLSFYFKEKPAVLQVRCLVFEIFKSGSALTLTLPNLLRGQRYDVHCHLEALDLSFRFDGRFSETSRRQHLSTVRH